ncbi:MULTISPECIES: SDR family oxidoreductase [Streptomyces]|uniref:SDR family oxidoreductase n=1 Tax=Streptomyces mordarskii TaxID=1226758 RepID=A0ABN1CAH4_9ACTN|nr:SDR family oxidoreductase [Streptomyces antimycoticus]WTB04171.1 SDR family oxidoreductase [Streptomyces antimycoticus]
MAVLFTGATGFLGSRILRHLLAEDGDDRPITVLGRGGEGSLRARVGTALDGLDGLAGAATPRGRLRYVPADLTLPGLGLTDGERRALTDACSVVWHCAAHLALHDDPVPLFKANVLGTRRVLDLATEAAGARVVHLSTAYVAGGRAEGHIREDDLDGGHGFLTPYEESKYTAERAVHAWSARAGRGATILRPSLLVSDRPVHGSGQRQPLAVLAFLIHEALRRRAEDDPALASLLDGGDAHGSGLRVRVRAGSGGALNLVPVDYAAHAAVCAARAAAARPGAPAGVRTVHLTHPHNTPFATAVKVLERLYPGLRLDLVDDLDDPDPYESLFAHHLASLLVFTAQRRTYDRSNLLQDTDGLPDPKPLDATYLADAAGEAVASTPAA